MKLSWKDIATTVLAIAIAVLMVAKLRSYNWDFWGAGLLDTWKSAAATIGVLGLGVLGFAAYDVDSNSNWTLFEVVLGLAVIGLMVTGLMMTSRLVFVALGAVSLVLWAVSTSRHSFTHESASHLGSGAWQAH
jgi:hypothetical protein